MTENFKDTLKIVLKCYKDDKMTEEEVLTILESLLSQNNNNGGGTVITYPINVPYNPNWWDTIRYQPYCTTSTTAMFDSTKQENNGQQNTNVSM